MLYYSSFFLYSNVYSVVYFGKSRLSSVMSTQTFSIFDNFLQENGTRLMALLTFTANETGGIDFTIITFEGKKPRKIGHKHF